MRKGWRWPLAGVAGLMVAISLFVIPAMGQGPVTEEVGVLHLHLNSDGDRFVFDAVAPGPNLVQTLSQTNCKLSSSGASLVGVVGSGDQLNKKPFAGLKDHRIGVGQNGEGNGEPCARINKDLGQALALSLVGQLDGQSIGYAEIDLGFKFDGDALLQLKKGGPSGIVVDTVTVACSGGSDCGPDSGGSDNERVILYLDPADDPGDGDWQAFAIDDAFDTVVIEPGNAASSGVVSLEGGFSGAAPGPLGANLGTSDTLFQVVEAFDGEIDCGDTVSLGGGDATSQITRGTDLDGGCKGPEDGLLFNFESGVEGDRLFVDFITEPVDADPDTVAQFLEVITWRYDGPPDVPGGESQVRILSYDDHVGAGERVMPWCLIDPRDGAGDLPVGTVLDPVDTTEILPTGHTSCLIESRSYVTGLMDILDHPMGTFLEVDIIYNVGDGKRSN
ncbi:MAG TPA: hypothetical protein VMS99_15920 [Acidimicrobiia bacterium]|nr:hypothetical protein [Acidimicrobiia bacterium]